MSTLRRLWVPLLVAALVAMLIGPSAVTAAEPRTVVRKIMIPAASFVPTSDNWDYANGGAFLETTSGDGYFYAPLAFPVQTVKIRKITLYAWDSPASTLHVCVTLYRTSPPTASQIVMAPMFCTADSSADPQVVSTTAISPRKVNTAVTAPYLAVWIGAAFEVELYGVAVTYSYEI